MERVISLDNKDLPISIFVDFSKAFETLDHTTTVQIKILKMFCQQISS